MAAQHNERRFEFRPVWATFQDAGVSTTTLVSSPHAVGRRTVAILAGELTGRYTYGEITPIVRNHVSSSSGHRVIGKFVGRSPKACLPSAYKCISTGTPAFFSAT